MWQKNLEYLLVVNSFCNHCISCFLIVIFQFFIFIVILFIYSLSDPNGDIGHVGSMAQLPTYILFENAVEVTRFPELDFEAKASHLPITKVFPQ